jgi:predicted ABC-class ATPase
VEARFTCALPARGRQIEGQWCAHIFATAVPALVEASLLARGVDLGRVKRHVESVEDQQALRGQLAANGLVAFVRNGAVLPRASGAADTPLVRAAAASTAAGLPPVVPFQSPPSLEVELAGPNCGPVRGLGLPRGVSLVVGGGFHGKSTLLQALQVGVYDHVPGDGREGVVVLAHAVKVAEAARCCRTRLLFK